jgi:RNA polymerase sigma-70 factor (ECF subfamily)
MPRTQQTPIDARTLDAESATWVARLQAGSPGYDAAVEELHALLLKAASFEVRRRAAMFEGLRGGVQEDLAQQSADDALMAILRKLTDFRGDSRFTTWAYKFALLEAAVKVRRHAWQGREVQLEPASWSMIADRMQLPQDDVELREVLGALQQAIEVDLTAHQREVLVAITLNDVPIDVLAARLDSTRGALYKTLHDARRKLRARLAGSGLEIDRYVEARAK